MNYIARPYLHKIRKEKPPSASQLDSRGYECLTEMADAVSRRLHTGSRSRRVKISIRGQAGGQRPAGACLTRGLLAGSTPVRSIRADLTHTAKLKVFPSLPFLHLLFSKFALCSQ